MESFLTFLLIVSIFSLTPMFLYLYVWEGIIRWNEKYGKELTKLDFFDIPILVDDQAALLPMKLNFKKVSEFIEYRLNNNKKYIDKPILKSLQCTFTVNLKGGLSGDTPAIGASYCWKVWSWRRFKNIIITKYDLNVINKRVDSGSFDEVTMAELIIHEYLHRFMEKHYGDSDFNHRNKDWKDLGV